MDKKSPNIPDINSRSNGFIEYLKKEIGAEAFLFLNLLSTFSEVLIFSGVIRNYFLKHNGQIRDLDLVVNCDESKIESFINQFSYKKNSFGGYKILLGHLTVDLWQIEKTWAYTNHKVELQLFKEYNLPNTTFFNFSSIVFDFNNLKFIYSTNFKNFLETKEIDLVLARNPMPELCIVNTIYYKEKFRLKVSDKLKQYFLLHFNEYSEDQFCNIQLKHFNEVKFSYQYLKTYVKIFDRQINKIKKNTITNIVISPSPKRIH